jgi:ATP-dependent Clp protease ATP-binding subunit ClpC
LEIDRLLKRVEGKKYNFTYDQSLIDYISKVGFDETFGARPIKRAIQDKIEDLISEKILMSEIKEGENYNLTIVDENVVIDDKVDEVIVEKPKRVRKKKE